MSDPTHERLTVEGATARQTITITTQLAQFGKWRWLRLAFALGMTLLVIFALAALIIYASPNPGYDVLEHMIPMRDDVKLHTKVWFPRNRTALLPIILIRTPYGLPDHVPKDGSFTGVEMFWQLNFEGFFIVMQDIRGRHKSGGSFEFYRPPYHLVNASAIDESTDAYDTIDWLIENIPGNNGKISYDGWLTVQASLDPHPALAAISPQAPPINFFLGDDMHTPGGAFLLSQSFDWAAKYGGDTSDTTNFVYPQSDMYEFFLYDSITLADLDRRFLQGKRDMWTLAAEHPDYDSTWERFSAIKYLRQKKPGLPALVVGGWFDAEDFWGTLKTFEIYRDIDPGNTTLVLGPWAHGYWFPVEGIADPTGMTFGDLNFSSPTSDDFRLAQAKWFALKLKGHSRIEKETLSIPSSGALVFATGSNTWQSLDTWPFPKENTTKMELYLAENSRLSTFPPPDPVTGHVGFDQYLSDPDKPVAYIPRPIGQFYNNSRAGALWRAADQRFSADRVDVLTYQTLPLETPLVLAGKVTATIYVSTSDATDLDLIVKLIDESPDSDELAGGFQFIVGEGVLRARYRDGNYSSPAPLPKDQTVALTVDLLDHYHVFDKGHSVMIHVQSSWFPRIDRNPQKFVPNIFEARYPQDFTRTWVNVFRTPQAASRITLTLKL